MSYVNPQIMGSVVEGTLANRPAASQMPGVTYIATDVANVYKSDGTSWYQEGIGSGTSQGTTGNAFVQVGADTRNAIQIQAPDAAWGYDAAGSGQVISALTYSSTTFTATVPSNAALAVGQTIHVSNVAGFTGGGGNPNGTWTIASLIGGTQFTFTVTSAPTGGTYTANSGSVAAYGEGQAIIVYKSGSGQPINQIAFRVDGRTGGIGNAGGAHFALNLNSVYPDATQSVWIDNSNAPVAAAGLVISQATNQTGAMTQWNNQAGNSLLLVAGDKQVDGANSGPAIVAFNDSRSVEIGWMASGSSPPFSVQNVMGNGATGIIPLIVQGITGTTVDLCQIKVGSNIVAKVNSGGAAMCSIGSTLNANPSGLPTTGLYVGDVGWGSFGYFGIAHAAMATQTSFALIQDNVGDTVLNAASAHSISIRINNAQQMYVDAHGRFVQVPSGGTPTIANGAGIGTSPGTPTISGDDVHGNLTIVTGTGPTADGVMVTVTFSAAYAAAPKFVDFMPANAATSASGVSPYCQVADVTTTAFSVRLHTPAAGTTYALWYRVTP